MLQFPAHLLARNPHSGAWLKAFFFKYVDSVYISTINWSMNSRYLCLLNRCMQWRWTECSSGTAQDNFSKTANWRKVPSCQNLRLTNSISQFRCTCPLLKLCIKKADWSSWGRGEPLKYASAKRRRESDFIKNRRKFLEHKNKNRRAMWQAARQSHWEERGSQKVQSWAAPYTGVCLHRTQLERHTEERNYNYDRKEDREGSLVFQRPGGCFHRYTDAILSYLGFEIDLALICFCTGQLLGAVSRSSQECQCQHNALLYQVHITNFGTVIMWLQFELLYWLSIRFIPVVVGSFGGWL